MTNTAISVKGLKKSFKDKEVLKGVDFEVQRGSIFALLGSNGDDSQYPLDADEARWRRSRYLWF
ncbi:ABC-type histidine transport system ATPase subunit [Bacillus sp. RC92]